MKWNFTSCILIMIDETLLFWMHDVNKLIWKYIQSQFLAKWLLFRIVNVCDIHLAKMISALRVHFALEFLRFSLNSTFHMIILVSFNYKYTILDWSRLILARSSKPSSPGCVVPRRTWMQRRVSQSDVQFLLIKPLMSGCMCLRLQPLLLRYFKCQ